MDIYIKLKKKAYLYAVPQVVIEDVADVVATKDVAAKLNSAKIIDIEPDKHARSYLVSVSDVVRVVKRAYPEASVSSLGEIDTLVYYSVQSKPASKALDWLKIAIVAAILFVGSATAIMSFHNDAEIPKVFSGVFEMIFGYENEHPRLIQLSYSVGLSVGIILFFNHAFGKKLTDDPTPVEVQMSLYDNEVADTLIDVIGSRKENKNA